MTYSVNADGGYVAEVSYEGTAVFPEVKDPITERPFAILRVPLNAVNDGSHLFESICYKSYGATAFLL